MGLTPQKLWKLRKLWFEVNKVMKSYVCFVCLFYVFLTRLFWGYCKSIFRICLISYFFHVRNQGPKTRFKNRFPMKSQVPFQASCSAALCDFKPSFSGPLFRNFVWFQGPVSRHSFSIHVEFQGPVWRRSACKRFPPPGVHYPVWRCTEGGRDLFAERRLVTVLGSVGVPGSLFGPCLDPVWAGPSQWSTKRPRSIAEPAGFLAGVEPI